MPIGNIIILMILLHYPAIADEDGRTCQSEGVILFNTELTQLKYKEIYDHCS